MPTMMRALLGSLVLYSGAAIAATQVLPLGEPDKRGYLSYSVQCDSGARQIVQCVGGDQRCGYAGDQSLASLVDALCSGVPAIEPRPSEAPPMQTAPATP